MSRAMVSYSLVKLIVAHSMNRYYEKWMKDEDMQG